MAKSEKIWRQIERLKGGRKKQLREKSPISYK
jgi:hypothetical protein